ncbi:TlpA family protein disulfide reductase [Pedobacter hartonius]|uniref:AhpC/TSA family protein n=1 Tax=Pedobacter hartonius TaxID=425514 RepID=A0A1H4ETJ9_9SPHI|nr:TlpA disulfide reductase family protein [Pedobacter hartonius]SEA88384.1 AhpC/TSA family protein [Pedobacter hartonius]
MKKMIMLCRLVILFAALSLCSKNSGAQDKFKYQPQYVTYGETFRVTYRPDVPKAPVTGVVYFFRNYRWEGHDLPLTKTDSGYVGKSVVPAGTALMCYRFWVGDTVDVGGRIPYAIMVHATAAQLAPGAYTEWGLMRVKDSRGQMMPIVSPKAEIEPKVLVGLWTAKELENMDVQRHLFYDVARSIKMQYPNSSKADSILVKKAEEILHLNEVTEKEMIMVANTYDYVLHRRSSADSIKKLIVARYPQGLERRLQYLDTLLRHPVDQQNRLALNTFFSQYPLEQYPLTDYLDQSTGDPGLFFRVYSSAINKGFMGKQYDAMKALIRNCPDQLMQWVYDHVVDYPFHSTTPAITRQQQLDFSDFIVKEIFRRETLQDEGLTGRAYYAPSEWHRLFLDKNKRMLAFHAGLQYANEDFPGAMKTAAMIKPYIQYESIDFNKVYAKLLVHFHKNAEAKQFIVNAVKAGKESPEMVVMLEDFYTSEHHGDAGFAPYYTAMIPQKKTDEMHARVKKELIRVPAPDFEIQDLKGQAVKLSAQKGKVVVIDFWASWCYPCKQAMPGMQSLVRKYRSNSAVQFYFISTLEESPLYKKNVTDFIIRKKYDFEVLYDTENNATRRKDTVFDAYAKLLHLSGIPQKVIIDQDGFVRWVAGGFDGDTVGLTREVDYAISLISQKKSE